MARWLVQLDGEWADLEEFPHWSPDGDIFAFQEGEKVYLAGLKFELCEDAAQVQDIALQVIEGFLLREST